MKFVNMLMNDTTFLLDESMDTLKTIRELQDLKDNPSEWNKLNDVREGLQCATPNCLILEVTEFQKHG